MNRDLCVCGTVQGHRDFGGDVVVCRRCDACRDTMPILCTLRLGHRGDHWHDPAGDVTGACGLPVGPQLRLVHGGQR